MKRIRIYIFIGEDNIFVHFVFLTAECFSKIKVKKRMNFFLHTIFDVKEEGVCRFTLACLRWGQGCFSPSLIGGVRGFLSILSFFKGAFASFFITYGIDGRWWRAGI